MMIRDDIRNSQRDVVRLLSFFFFSFFSFFVQFHALECFRGIFFFQFQSSERERKNESIHRTKNSEYVLLRVLCLQWRGSTPICNQDRNEFRLTHVDDCVQKARCPRNCVCVLAGFALRSFSKCHRQLVTGEQKKKKKQGTLN